jgi:hypothetical protein
MKKITYYKVVSTDGDTISLTNKEEADALAVSEFFVTVFGSAGVVETVTFNIFDTQVSVVDTMKKELADAALTKLNSVDKYVLGLK